MTCLETIQPKASGHLPTLAEIEAAAAALASVMQPTPQTTYALLNQRLGATLWVKHENHTPLGSFKLRGGLTYMRHLLQAQPDLAGVIAATRGNHGQSVALGAQQLGLPCTIVVPHGNSPGKNRAMQALGAKLVVEGRDMLEACQFAARLAETEGLHMVSSFHPWLVAGVSTYGLEFLQACPRLETVYVAIGKGSGICGMVAARNALGLDTEIVGVVAEGAPAYALAFAQKQNVETESAQTIACGVACRDTDPLALEMILPNVSRVITVSEAQILEAMRLYFEDTKNLAEGAGAVSLAGFLTEKEHQQGKEVGVVLSGGNVDADLLQQALSPAPFSGG